MLALAVWAVFGQTLEHEFVNYDDGEYVFQNPAVLQGLSWGGFVYAITHTQGANWHPLTTLSHMADCQLYGLNPSGHHLTNVLLHSMVAMLLFIFLRQMSGAFWPAAFVSTVFAIHPLRVESVAWVAERKDVLSGLFFVLTLQAYVWYARGPRSLRRYAGVIVLFALGLMSKPMLVSLPLVMLVLDWWPLRRLGASVEDEEGRSCTVRSLLFEKMPFFLLSASACLATLYAQGDYLIESGSLSFPERLANAIHACLTYMLQLVRPSGLAAFYPHPGNRLVPWQVLLGAAALIWVSATAFSLRRTRPYLTAGWLWYLVMLLPVIGLVQVGSQAHADRYTYLPQIGLLIIIVWGALDLSVVWPAIRVLLAPLAVAIVAVLMVMAFIQTTYWRDSVSLWSHALRCTSRNAFAHTNLANALDDKGYSSEAIKHYLAALRIKPDSVFAHENLGIALARQGKSNAAISHFQQALKLATAQKNTAQAEKIRTRIRFVESRIAQSSPLR